MVHELAGQEVVIRLKGSGWADGSEGTLLSGKLDEWGDFLLTQEMSECEASRITGGATQYAWRLRNRDANEPFGYELLTPETDEKDGGPEELDKELGDVLREGFSHMDKGGYTVTVTVKDVDDLADVLTTLVGQTDYEDIKVTPGK